MRNTAESRLPVSQLAGRFLAPDLSPVDPKIVGGTGWLMQKARSDYSESRIKKVMRGLSLGAFLAPGMINDLQTMTNQMLIDSVNHQTTISKLDHQSVISPHQPDIQTIETTAKQAIYNFSQDLTIQAANGAIGLYERFFDDKLGSMHHNLVQAGLSVMGYGKDRHATGTDLGERAVRKLQKLGASPKEIVLGALASAVAIYPDKEKLGKWWIDEFKERKGGGKVASLRVKPENEPLLLTIKAQLGKHMKSLQSGDGWNAQADDAPITNNPADNQDNNQTDTNYSLDQSSSNNSLASTEIPPGHSVIRINGVDYMVDESTNFSDSSYVFVPVAAGQAVETIQGAITLKDILKGSVAGYLVSQLASTNVVQNVTEGRPVVVRYPDEIHVVDTASGKVTIIEFIEADAAEGEDAKAFNSDTGGQTAPNNPDQFEPPKLSPEQERVDEKLEVERAKDELIDTFTKGYDARTSSRDNVLNDPPIFSRVKEFNVAIYDPKTGRIYEGSWSDYHHWVAEANGIRYDQWSGQSPPYISASVFRLKGAGGISVLNIDSLNGLPLTVNDITAMQNAGYQVMGFRFNWLVLDPSAPEGFIQIPSPLH